MRWLALVTLLFAGSVHADDEPEDPSEPRPSVVHARLDGIVAHLTARFVLPVSYGYTQNERSIALPPAAAVTAARAIVGGVVHPLALTAAEDAGSAFQAITEGKPGPNRAWAIALTSSGSGTLEVQLAAPRAAMLELELELDEPTCFVRDVRFAAIPETWQAALDAALRRGPEGPVADLDAACGEDTGPWLALPSRELAARPFGDQRIAGVTGRIALGEHHLARVELDLARQISDVPADLATAIVIDASRSLAPDEAEAQRAIVAAYLRAAPQGRVQVIAYARTAQPLLPGWMTASQAAPRIDRAIRALAPRNGSNLDAGLVEAARWLARTTGTHRIVVFSDERLAERLVDSVDELGRLVPEATLVHVVAITGGAGQLARNDDALLAPLAAKTTGIAVTGALDEKGHVDATMLARPISLDHAQLRTAGWTTMVSIASTCPDDGSLDEGSSCTWWGEGGAASGPVTIEGVVWNRKLVRMLRPDPGQALVLARMLSAKRVLDDALQHEVDRLALAVNPVWSLFGTWGGKSGYADDDLGFGRGGFGSGCGCGGSSDFGMVGHGRFSRPRFDLHDQLAAAVAACHPGSAHVELTIETTLEEIVDVQAAVTPATPALRDCVIEAAWNTMLVIPGAPARATTHVAF